MTITMDIKKTISILLFFIIYLFSTSYANDGVYYTSGSMLIPVQETDITVEKEILTISLCDDGYARVDVQYVFNNRGPEKVLKVGFEAARPYNTIDTIDPTGRHPYISDFTVIMNGQPLRYSNAVVVANRINEIYTGPEEGVPEEFGAYAYAYYFRAEFKPGINKVHHTYKYKMSYGVGRTFEVPYWLTPATRWGNGQIDDFTLRIKAEGTEKHFVIEDSIFRAAEFRIVDGTGKIRHSQYGWSGSLVEVALRNGTVEWHSVNFKPEKDMNIQSADTYIAFNKEFPLGSFYDRSDNFYFWTDKKIPKTLVNALPYAHRGYVFRKKKLQKLFSSFWWYMPDPEYVKSTKDFTPREHRLLLEHK